MQKYIDEMQDFVRETLYKTSQLQPSDDFTVFEELSVGEIFEHQGRYFLKIKSYSSLPDIPEAAVNTNAVELTNGCYSYYFSEYVEVTPLGNCEKMIEKRPKYDGNTYTEQGMLILDTYICPNCNSKYRVDRDSYNFCPECGQRFWLKPENMPETIQENTPESTEPCKYFQEEFGKEVCYGTRHREQCPYHGRQKECPESTKCTK